MITFFRYVEATEFIDWKEKRQTGMNLTWRYYYSQGGQNHYYTLDNSQLDTRFAENNRQFIKLANILQAEGVTQHLQNSLASNQRNKKEQYRLGHARSNGLCFDENFKNFLNATVVAGNDKISEETLKTAVNIFFMFGFCPDYDQDIMDFYYGIFYNSNVPPETLLKTLARFSYEAKERNKDEHHQTAMALFHKAGRSRHIKIQ